jgi:hypothetical protein
MKKDIILALCSGALIGSLAALLLTSLPNLITKRSETTETNNNTPTQLNNSTNSVKPSELIINFPIDNSVADNKKIEISGETQINNTVVIESEMENNVFIASSDGKFKIPVSLSEGVNQFYITAYNSQGDAASKNMSIFYTGEKL